MLKKINVMHMVNLKNNYGVERQLINHLKFSLKNNDAIQHHVCSSSGKIHPSIKRELDEMGIPVIANRLIWPWDIFRFARYVRQFNIDIMHAHDKLNRPIKNRIVSKLAGISFVLEHEHGLAWNVAAFFMIRLTNKLSDFHIANSNAAKVLLKETCGINAEVIHNGINIPETTAFENDRSTLQSELGLSLEEPVVGFVGRLNTSKGVPAFIKMASLINEQLPHVRFCVVGDGPELANLKLYANQLGVNNINFLGYREDARDIMSLFTVLVLPAIHEAFGNVIVEAAYNKIPVVASNVDGIAEIIVDGETGFLVECTEPIHKSFSEKSNKLPIRVVDGKTKKLRAPMLPDAQRLADRVVKCLLNPKMTKQMGEKACIRAKELFSIVNYNNEINRIYRNIANRSDSHEG